jgi:hypothetical protein
MPVRDRPVGGLALRLVSRAEQEIRAYPRLHSAFYAAVTRNPWIRGVAGRAKDRVRGSAAPAGGAPLPLEEPEVRARRAAAVTARLKLTGQVPR